MLHHGAINRSALVAGWRRWSGLESPVRRQRSGEVATPCPCACPHGSLEPTSPATLPMPLRQPGSALLSASSRLPDPEVCGSSWVLFFSLCVIVIAFLKGHAARDSCHRHVPMWIVANLLVFRTQVLVRHASAGTSASGWSAQSSATEELAWAAPPVGAVDRTVALRRGLMRSVADALGVVKGRL